MPSHKAVEACLRRIVRTALKNDEEITVRTAREQAEEELGLDDGFLKEGTWKEKSKKIITQASEDPESDDAKSPAVSKKRARATSKPEKPVKKRKPSPDPVQSSSEEEQDDVFPAEPSNVKSGQADTATSEDAVEQGGEEDSDMSEVIDELPKQKKKNRSKVSDDKRTNSSAATKKASSKKDLSETKDQDESEMSEVLDEPPKKRRSKGEAKSSSKKSSTSTSSKTLAPDEEQIKQLQSQLVKCGVRKMWYQELKHCETNKAKISHLQKMLRDVGMTGRFSAARAEEIKEARELAEELESAKQFEKNWGTEGRGRRSGAKASRRVEEDSDDDDDESSEDSPPEIKAGAATGLVDFGDSGDDYSD